MKQYLYCVEDSLSKMIMPPFASPNDDVAKRDFVIGAIASNTPLQDLHLWKVGEFVTTFNENGSTFQLTEVRVLVDPTLSEVSMYSDQFRSLQGIKENDKEVENE